jgi:hypothetical protein
MPTFTRREKNLINPLVSGMNIRASQAEIRESITGKSAN